MKGQFMARETVPATLDLTEAAIIEALRQQGIDVPAVASVEELSDYRLVEKEELVNVPFVIVQTLEKASEEYGGNYVVCRCLVLPTMEKVVFADGSTGIASQVVGLILSKYSHLRKAIDDEDGERGFSTSLAIPVPGGLKASSYRTKVVNPKTGEKETKSATTYYLNTNG